MTNESSARDITAEEFDKRFDNGEDVLEYVDSEHPVVQKAIPRTADPVEDADTARNTSILKE